MRKPRLLDLFCGSGGAARGYHHAGFEVVGGVDLEPQPRFPFEFIQADALVWSEFDAFDAIHASPPCQFHSALSVLHGDPGARGHVNLIPQTQELLRASGLPYIIENVPGARQWLREPITLCGSMFNLRLTFEGKDGYLQRHRLFESNVNISPPGPCSHVGQAWGVYGHGRGGGDHKGRSLPADAARELMDMDWASRDGVAQAIPPCYTEHLGHQLMPWINR